MDLTGDGRELFDDLGETHNGTTIEFVFRTVKPEDGSALVDVTSSKRSLSTSAIRHGDKIGLASAIIKRIQ